MWERTIEILKLGGHWGGTLSLSDGKRKKLIWLSARSKQHKCTTAGSSRKLLWPASRLREILPNVLTNPSKMVLEVEGLIKG